MSCTESDISQFTKIFWDNQESIYIPYFELKKFDIKPYDASRHTSVEGLKEQCLEQIENNPFLFVCMAYALVIIEDETRLVRVYIRNDTHFIVL